MSAFKFFKARAILLVFEKFTRAYLFQIELEIIWLHLQIAIFVPFETYQFFFL